MAIFSNLNRYYHRTLLAALLFSATSVYAAAPVISNVPTPSVNDKSTVNVFAGITLTDADTGPADNLIVTVSYKDAKGSFSGTSVASSLSAGGIRTLTLQPIAGQSIAQSQADLHALVFDPTENQVAPGLSEVVNFTVVVTDDSASQASDTEVIGLTVTSENDAPTITATTTQLNVNDNAASAVNPVSTVTIGDVDTDDTLTLTVTLTNTANGTFGGLGAFTGGPLVYTLTSTDASVLNAACDGITFLPDNNRFQPDTTEDSTIAVSVSDGDVSATPVLPARTIRVTSINDTAVVTGGSAVAMFDNVTSLIFANSTVTDDDALDPLVIEVVYPNAKGEFTSASLTDSGFVRVGTTNIVRLAATDQVSAQAKLRQLVYAPLPNLTVVGTVDPQAFTIRAIDQAPGTILTGSGTLTVNVTSFNDPPVITNTGSLSVDLSSDESSFMFSGITVEDPDLEAPASGGTETGGDDFTATITVSGGVIVSGNFVQSPTNTYTFTGRLTDIETGIQAATYSAPSSTGTYSVTIKVSDNVPADSDTITFTANVIATAPGITGVLEGQQVLDESTIRPFSTIEFNSFGAVAVQRTVEVQVAKALGAFDILGSFTEVSRDPLFYIYQLEGSAVAATDAIQNLRFNPAANTAIPEAGAPASLTIRVKDLPTSTSNLSSSTFNVKVKPVNDSPQIGSDSPEYRINDDGMTTPFATMVLSDPDKAGTDLLRVTVSLIGQDVDTNLPKAGGGELSLPASITGVFTQLSAPADTYQFSGNPDEVNAILQGLVFTPTPDRNSEGERETVTFTVFVEDYRKFDPLDTSSDPFVTAVAAGPGGVPAAIPGDILKGGGAQRSDTTVIVLSVNGAPQILGVPDLSLQPFAVAATTTGSGPSTANPFADLSVTDDQLPNPDYDPSEPVSTGNPLTIDDTLLFTITLDNLEKGSLSGGGFTETETDPRSGIYTLSGTASAITTALDSVVFTLSATYPFDLAAPGQTEFALSVSDSPPASNTTNAVFEVLIRERSTAHIVSAVGDYLEGGVLIAGSLREAIEVANNNDIIVFDFPNLDFPVTIRLQRPLEIDKNLTVVGSGVDQLFISGDTDGDDVGDVSLFTVDGGAQLGLEQLTLEYGVAASYGGAVEVRTGSSLVARFCSFENNSAGQYGGAIDVFRGGLTIEQCLFLDNKVTGSIAEAGGAISVYSTADVVINNSTFVGNRQEASGGTGGGALYLENSSIIGFFTPSVEHCTFLNNYDEAFSGSAIMAVTTGAEVSLRNNIFADEQGLVLDVLGGGRFASLGSNIATDFTLTTYTQGGAQNITLLDDPSDILDGNPLLGPLVNNGGPTLTLGLLAGSPALDSAQRVLTTSGEFSNELAVDQRGMWRGAQPDIGAVESGSFKRLNVNEVYAGSVAGDYIEFYNPRDSATLTVADINALVVWVDGVEVDDTLTAAAELLVGVGFAWDATKTISTIEPASPAILDLDLSSELGTVQLKNAEGQELLRVNYVANFKKSNGVFPLKTGESITRYPLYEGGFLPHTTVVGRVIAPTLLPDPLTPEVLSSKGKDVVSEFGGNAPPIAIEDVDVFSFAADETIQLSLPTLLLDVVANDVDFDRTDILKITEVMPVALGVVNNAELALIPGENGNITLTTLPASPTSTVDPLVSRATISAGGLSIDYTPVGSPTILALALGETITDLWGYTILDYESDGTTPQSRGSDDDFKIANIKSATSYFLVTVTGVNETPVAVNDPEVGDSIVTTEENQSLRFLVDNELLNSDPTFNFGDLDANFQDFDFNGMPGAYTPELQSFALLTNDSDADNDNDVDPLDGVTEDIIPTLELVGVHPTATTVMQTTGKSALDATITLDLRAQRIESSIIYDPRGSEILNALSATDSVEDSFYYTIVDQHGASATAKVTITVNGINDVPVATDDPDQFSGEDITLELLAVDLLANDTDVDQNGAGNDDVLEISAVPATTASGALLDWNGTRILYDPTGIDFYENQSRNEVIVDSFVYTITDTNGGTSQATVSIEFTGKNDAPTAANDLHDVNENTSINISAGTRDSNGIYSGGVMLNDVDIDFNETTPDDDPWIIPQLTITTPLGAAFQLNTDGSFSYDANSAQIESLFEGQIVAETFPYMMTDNSRTSASVDTFKVETNSTEVVLEVLANDIVAGSAATPALGYAPDAEFLVVVESTNHELRDGLIIKIEDHDGDGNYDGVYPITVVDRDHFSIPLAYVEDLDETLGTWRPWFKITAFSDTDENGIVIVAPDSQTLIYSPKVNFSGAETFTYTIEDGVGGQDVAVVELSVIDEPLNSVICANDDHFKIYGNQGAVEVDVLINDNKLPALGSSLTITDVTPASATGTVTRINDNKALSYKAPSAGFTGMESFTYTVSGNGTSTAQATVTFEVIARENFLFNSAESLLVIENSTGNILDVLTNDSILPNYPVELVIVDAAETATSHGLFSIIDGQVSYSPTTGYTGPDTFSYTLRDELGYEIVKMVNVEVVEDVADFYAIEDNYVVWADTSGAGLPVPIELLVLANDATAGSNGDLFTIENLGLDDDAPDQVERVSFSNTAISYTPPTGATTESFTYEISDGTLERREALITITVIDSLPVIVAEDDVYCVAKNSSGHTFDVLVNDSSFPVVGWSRTITTVDPDASEGGLVTINGGNTLTYSPLAGFYGEEHFDYVIEDAFGQTATATVTVAVGMLITSPDAYVVLENSQDNPLTVLLNDDMLNRYAADYVISSATVPAVSGTVSVDGVGPNNQLLYTPEPNATGTVEITYTVTDQTGGEETESAFVEIISEKSDRAFADLVIRVTGVNDAPVLGGTEDDQITDKESTFPFDAVTLSDIDEGGDQEQTATVLFDSTLGAITSTGMTELSPGEYQVVGTPAQVVAALRAIEFTPFENLEPPIYYDVDFTLTITDGYIPTPIVDVTTVTVLAINDAPDPVDDSAATTPENQVIRFLADATLLPPVPFDFGDLDPDFQAVNGTGGTVTLLPVLQTPNLLANDIDVDIDDDETTIELINVHQTDVGVDQITATSALGATVVLDIRALRAETNILYDPRGSATLNALPAGESLVDSFYYTVIDQHGAKGIAKVSIIVTGVNDVPTAQNDGGYEVGEDGTILLGADDILSNDTDPDQGSGIDPVDDDAPIISNVPATSDLGANLTWNLGDDDITYDPTGVGVFEALSRNEFIEDSITYTISDENGGTSMATIALEIEGFNDAPIAADDLLETDENITNVIVAGARGNDGLYAAGLLSNDTEIDFDGSTPDDDHWVIPQREVTSPLGAALHIETDGSYSYDANSRLIDSLIEDEIAEEVFPYIVTDNFRTSTSPDSFKVLTDSTDVVLPVLSNDDVAGSVPVAVLGYTEDLADTDRVIIESANHELRDGLLVKIQSYVGTGAYNGVYPITVVDRNHFSVESPYAIDPAGTLGTWRPWFNITAFGETDQEGVVTISADAQTLVYTPKAGFYGSESFQYTIEDGIGGQDVTDVAITVLHDPLNNVLSGSDDRFQIGKGESAVEVDVLVNDNILPESGSAYTITGVAPDSATGAVSIINGGTGLSYTPLDTNFTGVDTFTYTVSGGGSSSTQATVTFNVIDREDYLDGSDDDFVVVQDSSANLLDVAANDASLPSFPVSFEVVAVSTPSAGGAASVDNGQVSYTPLASYTGLDSFTYTIRDASGGNITKTVDVQVVSNADDFYALDDHYIIVAGSGEYDLAVMFNDVATGANSSNLSIVNLGLDTQAPPAVERVAFTPGLIKYTVPATVPVGGKEVFNYEITDGTDQRREAVITVTIVDALPTLANALDDNYHVAKNASAHSLDVMLNDLPLPSAGWAWTITSATAASQGGSVVVDGGTAITYSPAAGFYGVESFDYTIEDIFGDASSATVTVAVGVQLTEPDSSVVLENSSLNDFPVLQNDDLLERFAADYTISAVGTPDQAGAVVIDGSGPNNQLLYTPAEDFVGEETFTYTVVDKTGGTAVETVTVEVIAEESDRDFAELRVEITGVNDTPQLTGIANGATTDKLSVKPFPAVSIIDLDEWAGDLNKWGGEQLQNITVEYDEAYGTVVTPGMIRTSQGVYQMTGTPAAVTAALNAIVFTPYENFIDYIDPGFFALDFDLSIDDTYLLGQVNDTATIVITPIDDVPTITDPIADMVLQVNAFPRVVQLGLHFADVDDDIVTGQIVWTVSDYTNPSLFNRVTVDAVKQQLVLDFATDQFGVAEITVRGTDRGGLYVEDTFRVTVDGPPVIELAAGETQPTTANYVQGSQSGFRRDYRQSFRVTNEGVLTAAAFILHITELNVPVEGITVFSGTYSTDENGSPNNFNDDTRSSGGVTLLRKGTYYYALKYDFPLEPGESVVVHVTYRVATVDVVPIRPNIRVELTSATPLLPIGTSVMVISNPITGEPTITFMVQSGVSYQMQYSSNLTNWFPWSLIIPVSDFDREITITDDGLYTDTHPSLILQRFYRLVEISIP
jgi:VCBS repeat-containing protein